LNNIFVYGKIPIKGRKPNGRNKTRGENHQKNIYNSDSPYLSTVKFAVAGLG
jgi:hypothetical protein